MSSLIVAIITIAWCAFIGVTTGWSIIKSWPKATYRVSRVKFRFDHDVENVLSREEVIQVVDAAISQFMNAGYKVDWDMLRRYEVVFRSSLLQMPGTRIKAYGLHYANARRILIYSGPRAAAALQHEIRLAFCHVLFPHRSERGDLKWMHEAGVAPYPDWDRIPIIS